VVYVLGGTVMICRGCGKLYFRVNKQKICRDCYTHGRVKEKVFYTKKVWKKFSWGTQQKLSEDYAVIFEYEKPMKEKIKEKLKGTFKRNDPVKRKERRDKLFKRLKKIAKGVTSESGNKKLKNFTAKLNDHSSTNRNLDGLISKRRVPKF